MGVVVAVGVWYVHWDVGWVGVECGSVVWVGCVVCRVVFHWSHTVH